MLLVPHDYLNIFRSPATRFRWLQDTVTVRGNVWALDNVYLGEGCPWMCSGHGYCSYGLCVSVFSLFCEIYFEMLYHLMTYMKIVTVAFVRLQSRKNFNHFTVSPAIAQTL